MLDADEKSWSEEERTPTAASPAVGTRARADEGTRPRLGRRGRAAERAAPAAVSLRERRRLLQLVHLGRGRRCLRAARPVGLVLVGLLGRLVRGPVCAVKVLFLLRLAQQVRLLLEGILLFHLRQTVFAVAVSRRARPAQAGASFPSSHRTLSPSRLASLRVRVCDHQARTSAHGPGGGGLRRMGRTCSSCSFITLASFCSAVSSSAMAAKHSALLTGEMEKHVTTAGRVTQNPPLADGRCCGRWPMLSPEA
eukprot:2277606-Prymnesium_polylepis.1